MIRGVMSGCRSLVWLTAMKNDHLIWGERVVNVGFTGLPGPAGNTGSEGSTGFTGYTGVTGHTGVRGSTGATGPKGQQGSRGQAGSPGSPGALGHTGATGPQGSYFMQQTVLRHTLVSFAVWIKLYCPPILDGLLSLQTAGTADTQCKTERKKHQQVHFSSHFLHSFHSQAFFLGRPT